PPRILEVNPRHAIIRNLAARAQGGGADAVLTDAVTLLFENAMLADGIHPNPSEMAQNVQRMMELATRLS
ncbi:MAG: molecular chaperone HtpG, partial [Anaerolineae bacterium]|nr:molecular chaperone HtpG [Anaerolineae bacterium]